MMQGNIGVLRDAFLTRRNIPISPFDFLHIQRYITPRTVRLRRPPPRHDQNGISTLPEIDRLDLPRDRNSAVWPIISSRCKAVVVCSTEGTAVFGRRIVRVNRWGVLHARLLLFAMKETIVGIAFGLERMSHVFSEINFPLLSHMRYASHFGQPGERMCRPIPASSLPGVAPLPEREGGVERPRRRMQ